MEIKNDNILIVDGIELDKTNTLFFNAAKLVLETEQKIIYLTGKAGTGKTTFLKYIRSIFKGNMVVLAPTGVAAVNARGQTIHSFFQIKPSVYVPNDVRLRKKANPDEEDKSTIYDHFKYSPERLNIIRGLELMIIDEISMVRCDLLDVIDRLLRIYRKKESVPFGSVQVILIGDTFQLPPVAPSNEWGILKNFYDSRFFFSSKVIKDNKPIYIELKKIYRQKEEEFIELLNRVRINQVGQNELDILNSRYNPKFTPYINSNYITLATHNRIADGINQTRLDELQTELKLFEATVSGIFDNQDMPTDRVLHLKEGAQIMFAKNDSGKKYCNGTIAKINKIEEYSIIVEFENKQEIIVEKQTWENITYSWNEELKKVEEKVIGSFTQFPVKLAWAITVHKSQGKTFEKVIADLGTSFEHGQVYVALSRCSTLSGLILKSRITRDNIIIDKKALEFAKTETPEDVIIQEFEKGKADKLYKKCRDAFDNNSSDEMLKYLDEAIKVRDDRETLKFKQYVRVKLKLFYKYKKEIEEWKSDYEQLSRDFGNHFEYDYEMRSKAYEYEKLIPRIYEYEKLLEGYCLLLNKLYGGKMEFMTVEQFKVVNKIVNLQCRLANDESKAGIVLDDNGVICATLQIGLRDKPLYPMFIRKGSTGLFCLVNIEPLSFASKFNIYLNTDFSALQSENLNLSNIIKEKEDLIRQLQAEKSQVLQILNQSNFESDDLP